MAETAFPNFIENVCSSGLLTPEQIEDLAKTLKPQYAEPIVLARELVRRGWLTSLQANRVLTGRVASLRVGPYMLLEKLGEGETGKTYRAKHLSTKKQVALKILHNHISDDSANLRSFNRAIQRAARVEGPNILRVYDLGHSGGQYYLLMDYVPGTDLESLIQARGKQPIKVAVNYARQVAMALHKFAEAGQTHGDIKPSHILLNVKERKVVVTDMGLANWHGSYQQGTTTPDYRAPEWSPDADIRADIYSLGFVLYALLAGEPPYAVTPVSGKAARHKDAKIIPIEHRRPEVPLALAEIIQRMTAARPEWRFQIPASVIAELTPFIGEEQEESEQIDFSMNGLHATQASGITTIFRAKPQVAPLPTSPPPMPNSPSAAASNIMPAVLRSPEPMNLTTLAMLGAFIILAVSTLVFFLLSRLR